MALEIYNTLTRKKEKFKPIKDPDVGMYTCGPTVYDYPHIGNYRAYIFADILKRHLIYSGYEVKHIVNITDIDDKTIKNSKESSKSLKDFTEFYTEAFLNDCESLNILKALKYTKATSYINEMVLLIEKLLQEGHAYKSEDGSVYFDIKSDKDYGKLSHFKLKNLKENAGGRLTDEYEKENASDFALWKAYTEDDGDNYWETSLGKGRPGWHIECSAMSMCELGESFDIHTGGVDNIFPHHENEIAQSECATDKMFVKYFVHNEHLLVDNKKMSKSLGNFYTLKNLKEKGIDPILFRFWLYSSHYRSKANFTFEAINGSNSALMRLKDFILSVSDDNGQINEKYKNSFKKAMDDDLNTPKALAVLWDLVKSKKVNDADKKATIIDFDRVLGLGLNKLEKEKIPEDIIKLAEERENTRINKNWAESDRLREEIESKGYQIKDTPSGYQIHKVDNLVDLYKIQ